MDIINATEICPLNLEKEKSDLKRRLRQKISDVISKNIN